VVAPAVLTASAKGPSTVPREADGPARRAGQRRVGAEHNRVVVLLRRSGGHRTAVDIGLSARIVVERGERLVVADCAEEWPWLLGC
jgi:hypothetical protein